MTSFKQQQTIETSLCGIRLERVRQSVFDTDVFDKMCSKETCFDKTCSTKR